MRKAGLVPFVVAALAMVPTASAHGLGTVTNEWIHLVVVFQVVTLLGFAIAAASAWFSRTRWSTRPRRTVTGIVAGVGVAMVGTVAMTQIQLLPYGTTPSPVLRAWYPRIAFVAGSTITLGSLAVGWRYWFDRPRYWLLGVLLGQWVLYPAVMPRQGVTNPLGYVLVAAVVVAIGDVVWRDVRPALSRAVVGQFARRVGIATAVLFGVFYLFSAGLLTVNPEDGVNAPTHAFVTVTSFSNPLVMWPAVEFGAPSLPFFPGLSVGTVLVIGLLAGLVGINASLMTVGWLDEIELAPSEGVAGVAATTGATACCCCGPAVYAMVSGVFGVVASPLFWAFTDPTSPFGALFFVSSVALLTGSSVRLTRSLADAGACRLSGGPAPSEQVAGVHGGNE
ncbi:MAG: hypothetical protein ABEI96_01200 [Haloarculaceae archaeon]